MHLVIGPRSTSTSAADLSRISYHVPVVLRIEVRPGRRKIFLPEIPNGRPARAAHIGARHDHAYVAQLRNPAARGEMFDPIVSRNGAARRHGYVRRLVDHV